MDKSKARILIADDEASLRLILAEDLSRAGFHVVDVDSGTAALDALGKQDFDVLLLDLKMPGLHGMEVLKQARESEASPEVIILTGYASVSSAVEAMKLGAYDYLTKPFKLAALRVAVEKAFEKKRLVSENLKLRTQIRRQTGEQPIVTRNRRLLEIIDTVAKIAGSGMPVLVCGESGVGKELIARKLHDSSERAEGPFIPINCGAIPETMLETELFGREKGAFTGAHTGKPGLLEIASGGTLFLDEIAELTMSLQGKLLRALETGTFFRVGGVKQIRVDVTVVSATNRNVRTEIEKGRFREDLYYRISAFTVELPPLRERKDDIPLLVEHFCKTAPSLTKKQFSSAAMHALVSYAWPGNVRELKNVVLRALILAKGDLVEPVDLPADLAAGEHISGSRMRDVERAHILRTLKEAGGHRGKAAETLGIDPKTLYRKLLRFGIKE